MRAMFCDDYDLNKNTTLGSLEKTDFEGIITSENYQTMCKQSRRIAGSHCSSCSVKKFCGSGCNFCWTQRPRYKFECRSYLDLGSHTADRKLRPAYLPVSKTLRYPSVYGWYPSVYCRYHCCEQAVSLG